MRDLIQHFLASAWRSAVMTVAACCIFAGTSSAQESGVQPPSANQSAVSSIPSYPNSTKGLEKLMKDMMKIAEAGDLNKLASYTRSLAIPDPLTWYKSVFGEPTGLLLAAASESARSSVEVDAQTTISSLLNKRMTEIHVVKFEDSCSDLASAIEYPILLLREHPQPLFDVRFHSNPSTGVIWGFFAYIDDGFRYVGDIQKRLPTSFVNRSAAKANGSPAAHVQGNVQAAKMIHQELPVYPVVQKARHQQGRVVFHAIVGKDGTIHDLNLIEGECAFAKSASDAVKKWRYSPTTLNGDPVDVDTTITVNYQLGG